VIKILAALFFDERFSLINKIRESYYISGDTKLLCVFIKRPKTEKDIKRILSAAKDLDCKFILPREAQGLPRLSSVAYDGHLFVKRGIAQSFLNYAKFSLPEGIIINDDGFLGENYYKTICRFTNFLEIKGGFVSDDFKDLILKESGIVLNPVPLPDQKISVLNLSKNSKKVTTYKALFDFDLGVKAAKKLYEYLPDIFSKHCASDIAAAFYYEWGEKNILNIYSDLILKELKMLET
jgi:hypothetical protein